MPFKLLRSPSSTTDQSKKSRLRFKLFYFATGDTQKDSGLEIEFMLDTGASCSIIIYRTFWEVWSNPTPNHIESKHQTNKDLLWPIDANE